jgi:hypothetical protein
MYSTRTLLPPYRTYRSPYRRVSESFSNYATYVHYRSVCAFGLPLWTSVPYARVPVVVTKTVRAAKGAVSQLPVQYWYIPVHYSEWNECSSTKNGGVLGSFLHLDIYFVAQLCNIFWY